MPQHRKLLSLVVAKEATKTGICECCTAASSLGSWSLGYEVAWRPICCYGFKLMALWCCFLAACRWLPDFLHSQVNKKPAHPALFSFYISDRCEAEDHQCPSNRLQKGTALNRTSFEMDPGRFLVNELHLPPPPLQSSIPTAAPSPSVAACYLPVATGGSVSLPGCASPDRCTRSSQTLHPGQPPVPALRAVAVCGAPSVTPGGHPHRATLLMANQYSCCKLRCQLPLLHILQ